ncbi:hypothetical protein ACQUFR_11780 [Acinetobacter johnsonii]|uniref:hypothetical protein n=1 Tax=Acinetobacter johnsonii TaxID=40214 RepID=UPI003D1761B6
MAYITKDGKWLAYRDATQEMLEYDDFSDVQLVYQPEWFWVDNKDDAKVFHAESIAISFLVRTRGVLERREGSWEVRPT